MLPLKTTFRYVKAKRKKSTFSLSTNKHIQHLRKKHKKEQSNKHTQVETLKECTVTLPNRFLTQDFITAKKKLASVSSKTPPLYNEEYQIQKVMESKAHNKIKEIICFNLSDQSNESKTFMTNEDICKFCNTYLVSHKKLSIMMCTECGFSKYLLYCKSDYIENGGGNYSRLRQFKKFIMQFHEYAPTIPESIINIILKDLSYLHFNTKNKAKPTHIVSILRKRSLSKWVPFVTKISYLLLGKPAISLTYFQIKNLLNLYDKKLQDKNSSKKKTSKSTFNFEKFMLSNIKNETKMDLC